MCVDFSTYFFEIPAQLQVAIPDIPVLLLRDGTATEEREDR